MTKNKLLTAENVKKYYSKHTRKETAEYFNITEHKLRSFLKKHGLQRKAQGFNGDPITKKNRVRKLREDFWKDKERTQKAGEKAQKTMFERYGDKNYNITKSKETHLERYGVDSYMKHEDFEKKSKETMLELYGTENGSWTESAKNKRIKTNNEKFGADNVLSKDSSIRKELGDRMIEKHGVLYPLQNDELKKKTEQTLLKRYGVINAGLVSNKPISKEEISLKPKLRELGFVHNDFRFYKTFSTDQRKYPDYYHRELKVVLEYNGAYWHKDKKQPSFWAKEWENLGYTVVLIWDFEYELFMNTEYLTLEKLISKYPCTYREKSQI